MNFELIKTTAGYMVLNKQTDEFVNDEHGNNCFDDISEAEVVMKMINIVWALKV
jgi:hypothetical protein